MTPKVYTGEYVEKDPTKLEPEAGYTDIPYNSKISYNNHTIYIKCAKDPGKESEEEDIRTIECKPGASSVHVA